MLWTIGIGKGKGRGKFARLTAEIPQSTGRTIFSDSVRLYQLVVDKGALFCYTLLNRPFVLKGEKMQRPLPHDDTIAAAAIRSVHGRGFYDSAPHSAQDTHLMAQFLRLVEETGEYQSARLHNLSASEQGSEIADVAIVAYQIAWLTGIPLDSLQKVPLAGTNFSIEIGALARALRKWNGRTDSSGDIARALQRTVALCHILAEQMGLRLPELVSEKLTTDERRGYQHSGAVK